MLSPNKVFAYVLATYSYGFARSVYYNYDRKESYHNRNLDIYYKTDALIVDKSMNILADVVWSPIFILPNIYKDFKYLELKLKKKNLLEYGFDEDKY